MKQKKNRVPLCVEPLEDRWVPATIRYTSGALIVSNPSITAGSSSIALTATGANMFSVSDNGHFDGTYSEAGNIYIFGGNAKESITFDLEGTTYNGNLFISTGNGADTVSVQSTGGSGAILGNTTILAGNGNDSIALNAAGSTSMNFGGTVSVTTLYGHDSVTYGNGTSTTTVGGDLTLTNPSVVTIGQGKADSIGGNLTVSSTLVNTGVSVTFGTGVTVGKNFTVTGGAGNDTVITSGDIFNGNVNLNLNTTTGVGADSISLAASTVVSGNLNVQTGSASTTFDTTAGAGALTVQGSAYFNLGNNNNAFMKTGDISVYGNLQLTEGNGNDTVWLGTLTGTTSNSIVNGNLILNLGNGNDSAQIGGIVGGSVQAHFGNGADGLQLGKDLTAAGGNNYLGYVTFGNGADTLSLATNGLVSGVYTGGTNTGNVFQQTVGSATATLSPYFQLSNFP